MLITCVEHLNWPGAVLGAGGMSWVPKVRSLSVYVGVDDIIAAILSLPSLTLPFALSYLYFQFKGSKGRENWLN